MLCVIARVLKFCAADWCDKNVVSPKISSIFAFQKSLQICKYGWDIGAGWTPWILQGS
jgi:hypothetical protein